jgi:cbb3-type cytochrome oxidase maturation protein
MTIIYMLIPLGLVLLVAAVAAFIWAVRSGQFEDLSTPAERTRVNNHLIESRIIAVRRNRYSTLICVSKMVSAGSSSKTILRRC